MKIIYKTSIVILLALVTLSACSKKNNVTPTAPVDISVLATNWITDQWGGVPGNYLIFTIDKTTAKGTVATILGNVGAFTPGTVIFSNIKPNSDGTYSCSGSYNLTGSDGLSTRSATMSLQNNNTQLTVFYPAINASYPAITYVFQQTSSTELSTK
jgi:hypothetical protein